MSAEPTTKEHDMSTIYSLGAGHPTFRTEGEARMHLEENLPQLCDQDITWLFNRVFTRNSFGWRLNKTMDSLKEFVARHA
jgi:hypothetical protein